MAVFIGPNARQPRQFRRVDRQLTDYDDEEMRRRYRFGTDSLDKLEDLIGDRLRPETKRNKALSVRQQILIVSRFYATGNFLQVIGDTFGVDIATVSRTIARVTNALNDVKNEVIKFPTTNAEQQTVKRGFFQKYGFPGVIGCIDGSQVRIISPGGQHEKAFVNRKHYHSINVQATCDHLCRFTSIKAVWPGSCHDSHVFRESRVCRLLEDNHHYLQKGVLLGDSGYPCRPFLLTPFPNPNSDREENYNISHIRTRNIIERVFGIWKRKFHAMHSEVRMRPDKVSRVRIACAVLHNLSILWNEPDQLEILDDQPQPVPFLGPQDGRGVRVYVANNYFAYVSMLTV